MPTYKVVVERKAVTALAKVQSRTKKRIERTIDDLANDPRPPRCKKLEGPESIYRIRVGDYRILYQIRDKQLVVLVVEIGHRSSVYRKR